MRRFPPFGLFFGSESHGMRTGVADGKTREVFDGDGCRIDVAVHFCGALCGFYRGFQLSGKLILHRGVGLQTVYIVAQVVIQVGGVSVFCLHASQAFCGDGVLAVLAYGVEVLL